MSLIADSLGDELDPASRAALDEMRRASQAGLLPWRAGWLAWSGMAVTSGFVWEDEGRVVGNVSLRRAATQGGFFVGNVAVLPGWRRRGIAARLMRAALAEVRRLGGRWVGLEVRVGNDAARALYERLGFVKAGSTPRMVCPAGLGRVPVAPHSPLLRRARGRDKRALLNLVCGLVPPEHRILLEWGSDRYDPGWERTLELLLVGQRRTWWVADEGGAVLGAVRAVRDRGRRPHQLELLVAPQAGGRLEPLLVARGMASLGGAPAKAVETVLAAPSPALVRALAAAGFSETITLEQMRLDLQAVG